MENIEKEEKKELSYSIIRILKNYEKYLSDGYEFYCGGDEYVDETLKDIATVIIDEILKCPNYKEERILSCYSTYCGI